MEIYHHKQFGFKTVISLLIGLFLIPAIFIFNVLFLKIHSIFLITTLSLSTFIIIICLLLFGSLTVEITQNNIINLKFGIGIIKKQINLNNAISCQQTTVPWFAGWGIKVEKNNWLYSVSGKNAIEIAFQNGHKIRIGTDEPKKLLNALKNIIQKQNVKN